jgi:FkbM family methyltransferase
MPDTTPSADEIAADHARRVRLTVSCRDTDRLPKVEGAGEVLELDDGTRVQRMHNGLLVVEGAYLGSWTTSIVEGLHGHHEPQEEVAFHELLERIAATEPEPVMIELGSYWAYYSMWFARRTGGRVVDLEPDPGYMEVGRRNMEINGIEPTFVVGAVSDRAGVDVSFPAESSGEEVVVPGYTLESLMEETGVARVSLVLADIQGFERQLLAGIDDLVAAGRVRFMVISTHHYSISGRVTTHQETLARVAQLGGHVLAEHTIGESASGDGLVVVSFDPQDADMSIELSHVRSKDSYFGELEPHLQEALELVEARGRLLEEREALIHAQEAELQVLRARLAAEPQPEPQPHGPTASRRPWDALRRRGDADR